jgi:OmpA-OmpF porin, OOP family
MMIKLMKRLFLISPLLGLMLTACTTTDDKNQPPPPVEPPVEIAVTVPTPEPAPAPEPEVIVIEGVHFDFDKDTLKPSAVDILDRAVAVMQKYPEMRFSVSGHTDSVGSDAYNDNLSLRRANAVRDYMVQHGIASGRMDVSSHGERNPVADNSTSEGRARNRRVEIAPL